MVDALKAERIGDRRPPRIDLAGVKLPLVISLLNQLIGSGGNFLIGIYLARNLSMASFGLYGMGFGICLLYVGLGNAVILTQMTISIAEKPVQEREAYAASMLCAVLFAGCCMCAAVAIVAPALQALRWIPPRVFGSAMAVALASAAFLCSDFFASYAYQKHQEGMALMVNAVTMLVLISGLLIFKAAQFALSAEYVLLLYAAGAATASLIAYLRSPLVRPRDVGVVVNAVRESWHHGRWALAGVLITWAQAQAYAYVVAFFAGPAAVGQANAARIFVSPFSFLLPAVNKVAVPRLAELRCVDAGKMRRTSMQLTLGMAALAIVYALILLPCRELVSRLVLGRADPAVLLLIWPWCLVLVFQMLRSGGSLLMQIQRKFRVLTLISIPAAIATLVFSILTIRWFGSWGAISGIAIGEIVLSALIWRNIRHDAPVE